MNTVHLVGKLATDVTVNEYGAGPTGEPRVKGTFLLAVPRPVKDAEPDWVRVETWGKQAQNLARFNKKGSRVAVTGHLRSRFYNPDGSSKGGQLRSAVVAHEIVYLTPPSSAATGDETGATAGPRRRASA
jgi:single-strand DNA-binding protein